MFNDRAASRAVNRLGRSMMQAGSSMGSADGVAQGSVLVTLLKAVFWQAPVWKALRQRFRTEQALLILPLAVLGVFLASAFTLGLFGIQIGGQGLDPSAYYLLTTLLFWLTVLVVSLGVWTLTAIVKSTRRLIWWIRRG